VGDLGRAAARRPTGRGAVRGVAVAEEFLRLLVAERVTVLNQTPSAFYQLMRSDRDESRGRCRLGTALVVLGGEALDLWRLADWYERHADDAPVLVNMYGITETTVHVSYVALDRTTRQAAGSMIGARFPICGCTCWIRTCVRCHPEWWARCSSPVRVWPRAISTGPV
jgi:non-ribosomal peptide synthetase component F